MNAISDLSLLSPAEFSFSAIAPGASAIDVASGFHDRMRAALDRITALRRKTANASAILPKLDFTTPSVEELETTITDLEEKEQAARHYRKVAEQEIKSMRRSLARLNRNHFRPMVSKVGFAIDLALVEQLELLRKGRMSVLAELSSRPQARDGDILASPDDVRIYFDRLLAT